MKNNIHIYVGDSNQSLDDLNQIISQIRNVTIPNASGTNTAAVISRLQFLKGRIEEALSQANKI